MTEARIPTPRRVARTPVFAQPSAASILGESVQIAAQAGQQFEARRQATDEQVADIDHRIALDEQRRQDDVRYIEEAQRWVQTEAEVQTAVAELRQQAGPFARGHDAQVRRLLDEKFRAFDEGLGDNERVRQKLRLTLAQSAATLDVREQAWQREQEFKAQGEALESTVTTRRNQISRADPAEVGQQYAKAVAEADALIDAGAFNDDQASVMKRAVRTQLAPAVNDALFNAGQPAAVQKLLDDGFFDGLDIDVSRIGEQVGAEQRALDILAERQQAENVSKARADADAVEAKVKLGINPTQEEFDRVNAQLAAAGVPEAERIQFGGLSIQMGLNRQYSVERDPEGIAAAQTAAALRAKVAAGTANEAEQVAASHLSDVADARATEAGVKRRELAGQGVQGQMAVLADLDRMPPDQRFIAANAAMDGLGFVAGLPAHTRQYALAGREARKARAADFGEKAQVEQAFQTATADFAGFLGGSYDDMMELAWDIYAGERSSKGRTGFSPDGFGVMVNIAFGATRRNDGTVQGGVGDFNGKVILPAYQNQTEFERSLRSLTFDKAIYADGSKAVQGDVLDNYRPEYFKDSPDGQAIYRMIDARGRPLMKQGGGFYDFVVPRAKGGR